LRNPLEVVRITSGFDLSRRHPVLNTIRAHKGVDYGAATGTPIFATGKGKVAFIGGRGGYGKTIILQHGRKYSTLYAHMSRFKKGLKLGDRVEQGQVIGYVGKTGLATGPHLHYEFRINGKHTDPQTVEFPGAESLPKSELATFKSQSQQPHYVLNALQLPTVALAD
ncbi:MAG: M23 family metallopeptidase, partial [Pseudomonadota bacterium]